MRIIETYAPEGVMLLEPKLFADQRGYFMETYNRQRFSELGIVCQFVQDNQSRSVRGTLRGLHYQINSPQDKLVRVLSGEIFDVAVDIRPQSQTFGQWASATLTSENKYQFFVPRGFAHGFQVLSEHAVVAYKCSNLYSPRDERGILWSDPDLAITWPERAPLLSERDRQHLTLAQATVRLQGEALL